MAKAYKISDKVEEQLTVIKNLYNTRYSKYTDYHCKDNGYALGLAVDLLYHILTDEDAIEETNEYVFFSVRIKKTKGK